MAIFIMLLDLKLNRPSGMLELLLIIDVIDVDIIFFQSNLTFRSLKRVNLPKLWLKLIINVYNEEGIFL